MSSNSQMNLFGLDLEQALRRVQLGWSQLLWGDESGLRAWLADPVELYEVAEASALSASTAPDVLSVALPDSDCLVSQIDLPVAAEVFLAEAVASHVDEKSPFPAADVAWGHAITSRSEASLRVAVVMIARSTANMIQTQIAENAELVSMPIELWARVDNALVPIEGYQSPTRQGRYKDRLRRVIGSIGLGLVAVTMLLAMPAVWLSQTAAQTEGLLVATQKRVAPVVSTREKLVTLQSQKTEADTFFSSMIDYAPWLHRVAEITPDTAHLNRLALDGRRLTISGVSDNAADYQATLVSAEWVRNLSAPSAFTRDKRSGRERFTLTMTLVDGAEQ